MLSSGKQGDRLYVVLKKSKGLKFQVNFWKVFPCHWQDRKIIVSSGGQLTAVMALVVLMVSTNELVLCLLTPFWMLPLLVRKGRQKNFKKLSLGVAH